MKFNLSDKIIMFFLAGLVAYLIIFITTNKQVEVKEEQTFSSKYEYMTKEYCLKANLDETDAEYCKKLLNN